MAEQEYLSGNSHPSFIIDHKEDLIGGSNSWVGGGGGGGSLEGCFNDDIVRVREPETFLYL